MHGTDGKQYVRRRPGEAYHPDCITRVKHPESQMVWGCISSHGVGCPYFVKGTVNAAAITDILETRLLPIIRNQFRLQVASFKIIQLHVIVLKRQMHRR